MINLCLGLFLLLFGVTTLFATEIPHWVVGAAACITGIVVLLYGERWWTRRP